MSITQKLLEDKTRKLKEFYQFSNYNCRIGKCNSCKLAKMDLNTILFILHDGTTYDNRGSKSFVAKRVRQVLRNLKKHLKSLYSLVVLHVLNFIIFKDKVKNCWLKTLGAVKWEYSLNKTPGEYDMSIPSSLFQVGRRTKLYLWLRAVV